MSCRVVSSLVVCTVHQALVESRCNSPLPEETVRQYACVDVKCGPLVVGTTNHEHDFACRS